MKQLLVPNNYSVIFSFTGFGLEILLRIDNFLFVSRLGFEPYRITVLETDFNLNIA